MVHFPSTCTTTRIVSFTRSLCKSQHRCRVMAADNLLSTGKKHASFRLCNVSSFTTELLEVRAEDPKFHVLFIPGNPGVVAFYEDFVEAVYYKLGGSASVTAIGHIGHTKKDWEHGKLFSLQDQIDHKVDFIKQEFPNSEIPLVLVGHSIGSYMSLEILREFKQQVKFFIGLYPFLSLNQESFTQTIIGKIIVSRILCFAISSSAKLFGLLPSCASRFLARRSIGKSWSVFAVDALCNYLLQYHTVRNLLFLAMTEFKKLAEEPDWKFIREKQDDISFLFGIDDHWGPLSMFEKISKQVPDVALSIEREGHKHAFCSTEAGSVWVADHVVNLIKKQIRSQGW